MPNGARTVDFSNIVNAEIKGKKMFNLLFTDFLNNCFLILHTFLVINWSVYVVLMISLLPNFVFVEPQSLTGSEC